MVETSIGLFEIQYLYFIVNKNLQPRVFIQGTPKMYDKYIKDHILLARFRQ